MRYHFTGKNINVSEHTKERVQEKLNRLERLLPADAEVSVTFSVVKQEHTVEVTVPLQRRILRAEVTTDDLFASVDGIVDVLDKQMVKYKTRLKHKSRRDNAFKAEMNYIAFDKADAADDADDAEADIRFEKTKRFTLRPMDEEEAVMEMEMLGHTFFVFRNAKSDAVNVVYKRRGGSYGLIDPEY